MLLCCLLFLFPIASTASSSSEETGPYKLIMLDITNQCNRTSKPFEQVPTMHSIFWVFNTTDNHSLIAGNITLDKDQKNLKGSFKIYYEKDGKRKIEQLIDNIDCKTFVVPTLMKLWGYDVWKDYCTIPKGTYNIKMDYNKAMHLWTKKVKYGVLVIKTELTSGLETVVCVESKMILAPDTSRKKAATRRKNKYLPSV